MKLYSAIVCVPEHGGIDILVTTKKEKEAYKILADWCRSYADDAQVDDEKELEEMSDKEAIKAYFASENIIEKGEMGAVEVSELEDV